MKHIQTTLKMITAGACLLATTTFSNLTYAGEYLHHGTQCITANLAQGGLFAWNKDGLTNNFVADLFIICPITLNQDDWDGTPSMNVEIEMFMPPGYTNPTTGTTTGPQCFVRFGVAPTGTPTTDDVTFSVNQAMNIGTFSGSATTGDIDNANLTATTTNSANASAHILCLVPNGGTMTRYAVRQQ